MCVHGGVVAHVVLHWTEYLLEQKLCKVNFTMQNECQQANKFMKIIASLSF